MNIKISELYTKCEDMAKAIGLSVNDRFVFDLQDDTSLDSIKNTFKGIDKILLPGYGRYMVLMVSNEKPNVLMAVFPETEEFDLKLVLFNVKNQKSLIVGDKPTGEEDAMTLDNFEDALATDDVEKDVNDFLFSDEDEEDDEEDEDKGEEDKKPEDEKGEDDASEDEEDEVVEPGKEDDKEEGDAEPKDDEDKNPAELGDGEPADVEAGDEPETKDEEPSDVEKADDEEDEDDEGDDDIIDVVDDEEDDEDEEEVDEDTGATGDAEGTPANAGDEADKEVVVSEDADPADVGEGADEDKPAKAEGVTGEGDGDPAPVGDGADADKPAKVEGATGEGDGKPAEVGDNADKEVVKEGVAPVEPAPAPVDPAPAPAPEAPEAPVADTVTDPEKDIRALIKFYTDELARKTADETVSTEVVSGIQAIIAGLVKNLEAMTDLQDTETEEAKAAAKAAKDDAKKEEKPEEVSEDGVPPAIETDPAVDAGTDSPAAKVGGDAGVPVDQNVTLSTANMTPDLKTLQPADVDVALPPPDLVAVPGDPMNDLADVELTDAPAEEPSFDTTVDVPDVTGAGAIITDAPIDPATGLPKETPAGDDAALDSNPPADIELPGDEPSMLGPDGLPAKDLDAPSDKFIDDQIASLGATPDTTGDADAVNFVPGANTINWSDNLYDTGAANSKDNSDTVPQALKELKEYAERVNKKVGECTGVNEVTIGRINKFCNLCATAYDTWHKIQDALNASNPLREAMECNMSTMDKLTQETDDMAADAAGFDALEEQTVLKESAEDFARVQDYIKSIKHLL